MQFNRRALELLAFALLLCWVHVLYVAAIQPDVAYMDTLRYITYFKDVLEDPSKALQFWEQGQHRGLWSQVVLWINMRFFGMNILAANLLTPAVLFAIACVHIWLLNSLFTQHSGIYGGAVVVSHGRWFLACGVVSVVVIYSPAAFELFTLDLGFPEISRNLTFLLTLVLIERWVSGTHTTRAAFLVVCVAILFCILVIGYGRSIPFVVALGLLLLALLSRRAGKQALTLRALSAAVVAVGAVGVYVFGGSEPLFGSGAAAVYSAKSPWEATRGALVATGAVFVGVEAGQTRGLSVLQYSALGGVFFTLSLAVAFLYLRLIREGWSAVPLALLTYGLATALAVGVARGGIAWMPASSRFYPDLALAATGFILIAYGLLVSSHNEGILRGQVLKVCLGGVLGALIVGHSVTYLREWQVVPYRAAAFDKIRFLTVYGNVDSKEDWLLLQSDEFFASRGVQVQRELCLGPTRSECRRRINFR